MARDRGGTAASVYLNKARRVYSTALRLNPHYGAAKQGLKEVEAMLHGRL